MRSSSSHIRQAVYRRDKGICAKCGCDADSEYRAWNARRREVARLADRLIHASRWNQIWIDGHWAFKDSSYPDARETKPFRAHLLEKYAPGNWTACRSSGWDADHIVPVAEGGGECDLDNYRTLCHPCHKLVTAELAARLAEARRAKKQQLAEDEWPTFE